MPSIHSNSSNSSSGSWVDAIIDVVDALVGAKVGSSAASGFNDVVEAVKDGSAGKNVLQGLTDSVKGNVGEALGKVNLNGILDAAGTLFRGNVFGAAKDALDNEDVVSGVSGSGSLNRSSSGSGFWSNPSLSGAADLVNDTAMSNNEWSAQQAELDRAWQEYMSNTAHQRETRDLIAAGLNPVLSAGGSGASTPSGAMAQTDTSNTRIIGELAMQAIDALSVSALGASSAGKDESGFWNFMNKNSKAINSISSAARSAALVARAIAAFV